MLRDVWSESSEEPGRIMCVFFIREVHSFHRHWERECWKRSSALANRRSTWGSDRVARWLSPKYRTLAVSSLHMHCSVLLSILYRTRSQNTRQFV